MWALKVCHHSLSPLFVSLNLKLFFPVIGLRLSSEVWTLPMDVFVDKAVHSKFRLSSGSQGYKYAPGLRVEQKSVTSFKSLFNGGLVKLKCCPLLLASLGGVTSNDNTSRCNSVLPQVKEWEPFLLPAQQQLQFTQGNSGVCRGELGSVRSEHHRFLLFLPKIQQLYKGWCFSGDFISQDRKSEPLTSGEYVLYEG